MSFNQIFNGILSNKEMKQEIAKYNPNFFNSVKSLHMKFEMKFRSEVAKVRRNPLTFFDFFRRKIKKNHD